MQLQPTGRSPVFSVLQNADFRALWCAGGLAEVARWMELMVLSWLVLQATDSPFQLGLVLVFNNVPRPFFSLFTGFVAERVSRHLILIVAQAVNVLAASALLFLIAADLIEPWHVFVIVFAQGVGRAFEDPARRTGLLDIVGESRLVNAMSLDVISNTAGKMAGPLLGGILLDTVDFSGAYVLLVAVHVVNLLMLLVWVKIPPAERPSAGEPMWRSLGLAIQFALHSPTLRGLLYVTIVMNAMAFPVRQFIPAIGRDQLEVSATLVGLLLAAESVGQLAGAAAMALTRNLQYLGRLYVIGSLVVLSTAALFTWSPWYALAFILLAIGGIGQAGFSTMQSTITLLASPREMRGRMMGLLSVCIGAGTPLGTLEMGALATLSTQWSITGNALLGLLLLLPILGLGPLARRPLTQPPPAAPGG
ncbi:MAG: MFS transporter [Chloroflexota bacterium]